MESQAEARSSPKTRSSPLSPQGDIEHPRSHVHHKESKWQRLQKFVSDLPLLAIAKTRSALISTWGDKDLSEVSVKSVLICFLVLLLGSFTILQTGSFIAERYVNPQMKSLATSTSSVIDELRQYFFDKPQFVEYDACLALSIGDDGDRPNKKALPYPLVSRLTDGLKREVESLPEDTQRRAQVLVGVDHSCIVCKIVRDTFAEVPGVDVRCRPFYEIFKNRTTCGKLIVGSTQRFVQQLPGKWSWKVRSQSQIKVDLDSPDPSHEPPALAQEDWQPTVMTGFSSNHLTVGLLLLRSIGKAMENSSAPFKLSVLVWQMEVFNQAQQALLNCVLVELTHMYGIKTEVRLFDWSAYPSWMHINNSQYHYFFGAGEYAWKPIMVDTVLRERGMVLWADAGDRFHGPNALIKTMENLNNSGFVSKSRDGKVKEWTHPLQLKYFRANYPEMLETVNCMASIAGFTLKKYRELVRPWYDCSMTRQCIAPDGSDRGNHRQDQAALTVLSVLTNNKCTGADQDLRDHQQGLDEQSGTYATKCYSDPLKLHGQVY